MKCRKSGDSSEKIGKKLRKVSLLFYMVTLLYNVTSGWISSIPFRISRLNYVVLLKGHLIPILWELYTYICTNTRDIGKINHAQMFFIFYGFLRNCFWYHNF